MRPVSRFMLQVNKIHSCLLPPHTFEFPVYLASNRKRRDDLEMHAGDLSKAISCCWVVVKVTERNRHV